MPLLKSVIKSLGFLGLSTARSLIDHSIARKIHGSGTTILVISSEEMNDIMKIVRTLENSGILLKGVTKTIKDQTRKQKGGFLSMLLGTLGVSLLGDLLTKNLSGKGTFRAGEGTVRAGERVKKKH